MLFIKDGEARSRAFATAIDERINRLVALRCNQLGGITTNQATFAIVQPTDMPADLEKTIGFSIIQNPADGSSLGEPDFSPGWEWIEDHDTRPIRNSAQIGKALGIAQR